MFRDDSLDEADAYASSGGNIAKKEELKYEREKCVECLSELLLNLERRC